MSDSALTVEVPPLHEAVPARHAVAWKNSPLVVAGIIFVLYGAWLVAAFAGGHDPREWVGFAHKYVDLPHAQALMHIDPHSRYVRKTGTNGMYYYFIAVDPVNARYFVDDAGYRYKHILYPMLARLLALGRASLIPTTMLLINWLAVAGGTLALAAWLKRKSISPWLALIYGLYPPTFITFRLDYTEPLSYGLMALAVYLYSFGGRRQLWGASLCFALSALTRDKAIAFAFFYGAGLLLPDLSHGDLRTWTAEFRARFPRAVIFGAIAALPIGAYELFLRLWLHSLPAATRQLSVPLGGGGGSGLSPDSFPLYLDIVCVVIPALICTVMGLWAWKRRLWRLETFALLITIQLSVTFAGRAFWADAVGGLMRLSIAVVLLALYCIPIFDRLDGSKRWWLRASAAGWLLLAVPTVILFAVAPLV